MNLFRKHSTLISLAVLMAFLVSIWIFPSSRLMVIVIFLLFGVTRAFATIITKHREAYLRGKITSLVFVRNVLVETTGLLLAMTLAGLLARYFAQIVTQQIGNDLIKFAAGIATGLLIGIGVGVLMHSTWERFIKTLAKN